MTLFIVTVTDDFAVVSQDTFVSEVDEATAARPEDCAAVDLSAVQTPPAIEGRKSPPTGKPKFFTSKMFVVPHLHMVIGGSGCLQLIMTWAQVATCTGARDLIELDRIVPECIERLAQAIKAEHPAMIFHVGLDKNTGRMAGFSYNAADNYRPTKLNAIPGHAMMPMPVASHEDYERLAALWRAVDRGKRTEEFHVLMAKNQFDSFWRGHYKLGNGIGGQLHTARIDRDGISVRASHEFPGYAEQLAEADGVNRIAREIAK